MRWARLRNALLAFLGTSGFVGAIVFSSLGCPFTSPEEAVEELFGHVESVDVRPQYVDLYPDGSAAGASTVVVVAILKDANGRELNEGTVTWFSAAPSIARVSSEGGGGNTALVTGVAPGSAVISATSQGKKGFAFITVLSPPACAASSPPGDDVFVCRAPVATVTVDPTSATVQVGNTRQLTAILRDASGNVLTDRPVTWSSVSPGIATVNSSGLVTGVGPGGPAVITATSEGKSGTAIVTVTAIPVATVTVSAPSPTVQVGSAMQLTATLKDAGGNVLTGRVVSWSSSAPSIATVTSSGLVTGVAPGSAVITAISEGVSGTAIITVTAAVAPVATVTVSAPSPTVQVGSSMQLAATLKDAGGNVLTGRAVTWSSGAPGIATVNSTGLVTGVATGSATITATSEGVSGSVAITVTPAGGVVLSGRVIDFTTQAGIGGAMVSFLDYGRGNAVTGFPVLQTAITSADGSFMSPGLGPLNDVLMDAAASGYVTGRVLVTAPAPSGTTATPPIPLTRTSVTPGGIAGTVRNARTDQGIANASVSVGPAGAAPTATTTTDGNGGFSFANLNAGTYELRASGSGYTPSTRIGVAVGNNSITSGQDLVLSPTTNDIRIVLTWGASPPDLDAHLTGPNPDGSRFHVYFSAGGSLASAPFANLDNDTVNGFGPETITITQMSAGTYRFSVHDFTNRSSTTSTALGQSGATVKVYTSAGLVQTFSVPNQAGTLWTVFEMTGSISNPIITARNQMGFESNSGAVPSSPVEGGMGATDGSLIGRAVRQHPKLRRPR